MSVQHDAAIVKAAATAIEARYVPATENDDTGPKILDACRHELDPLVYTSLATRYGAIFQHHWDTCTIPKSGDRTLVLVERRCHPNIKFCIQNAVYYARGWCLTIICSVQNMAYVQACVGLQAASVRIFPLFLETVTPAEGKREYNDLLQRAAFWKIFPQTHLLCIETDTYLRRPIPDNIVQYDYVAAKWPWKADAPGGGGLSYRKRAVMELLCSLDLPIQSAQDCFVSDAIQTLNFSYPTQAQVQAYFGEFDSADSMCGTHQWWTATRFYDHERIQQLLTCYID